MAYSAITTGEVDGNSPLTETLMTKIKDNIDDHTHDPTVGDGADISSWVHIQTNDITSPIATSDFSAVFSSTYDAYMVMLKGIRPATDGVILRTRMETGGSTWQTGSVYDSDYLHKFVGSTTFNTINSGAGISALVLTGGTLGNLATEVSNGTLLVYKPSSTSIHTYFESTIIHKNITSGLNHTLSYGAYNATTAVTGIRFYMSSGNITSGVISVYGMKYRGT